MDGLAPFSLLAASALLALLARRRAAPAPPSPSPSPRPPTFVTLSDYEAAARAKLTAPSAHPGACTYYAPGAGEQTTARRHAAALRQGLLLRPRMLVDVSASSARHALLGAPTPLPFGAAPTAFHALAHPAAEAATAAGCAAARVPYCVSGSSSLPMEALAAAAPGGRRLFQLYLLKDRGANAALLRRAEAAGMEAVVLTVDRPVLGLRDANTRCGFTLPGRDPRNANACAYQDATLADALSWEDVAWLRAATALPVVVKGVLRGDDGAAAVRAGCAAVWVSNHGGRQLDGVASGAEALAEVAAAVRAAEAAGGGGGSGGGRKVAVWVDGGVRRGSDVVKLLALGADFVWVGQPVIWGLAAAGAAGVEGVLATLGAEVVNALQLVGARSVAELQAEGGAFVEWARGWR